MSLRKSPRELPQHDGANAAAADADAPMTAEQIQALKALAGQAGDTDSFAETLTRSEAQKRIAALEALLDVEQHSGKLRLPRT